MKKIINASLLLCLLNVFSLVINAQVKKGIWYSNEITISYGEIRNSSLWQLNITAYICDEKGNLSRKRRCAYVNNQSKDTLYYRNAPIRYYQSIKNAVDWTWSPANVLTYYPIPPGKEEIICFEGYEDAKSRELPCNMIAEFKFFVPDALDKVKRTRLLKKDETHPIQRLIEKKQVIKKVQANSFYAFFTTDINVKQKESQFSGLMSGQVLTVISKPVPYTGSLNDPLLAEKATFVDQIVQQVSSAPDKYKQMMANENYQAVHITYAKPYSSVLLKNEKEVYEAIKAYKDDWHKMTNGLSLANSKEFYQLK